MMCDPFMYINNKVWWPLFSQDSGKTALISVKKKKTNYHVNRKSYISGKVQKPLVSGLPLGRNSRYLRERI